MHEVELLALIVTKMWHLYVTALACRGINLPRDSFATTLIAALLLAITCRVLLGSAFFSVTRRYLRQCDTGVQFPTVNSDSVSDGKRS